MAARRKARAKAFVRAQRERAARSVQDSAALAAQANSARREALRAAGLHELSRELYQEGDDVLAFVSRHCLLPANFVDEEVEEGVEVRVLAGDMVAVRLVSSAPRSLSRLRPFRDQMNEEFCEALRLEVRNLGAQVREMASAQGVDRVQPTPQHRHGVVLAEHGMHALGRAILAAVCPLLEHFFGDLSKGSR